MRWLLVKIRASHSRERKRNIPTTGGETCDCTIEETLIVRDWELEDAIEFAATFFFLIFSAPRSSFIFLFLLLMFAIFRAHRSRDRRGIPEK